MINLTLFKFLDNYGKLSHYLWHIEKMTFIIQGMQTVNVSLLK